MQHVIRIAVVEFKRWACTKKATHSVAERKNKLFVTFRVSRRRLEMYIGHGRLCVCVSVPRPMPTLLNGLGCNLGEW